MEKQQQILEALKKAYWKEMETLMNYLPNSVNLDGIRAEEVKEVLTREIEDELGHAKMLANRIKDLEGSVPGSFEFKAEQKTLQPPVDTTNLKSVVQGVIDAEEDAIQHYKYIIDLCDGVDHVTQDMCISLLQDEETHRRIFKGFMKELDKD
jgi:bacterioferritin